MLSRLRDPAGGPAVRVRIAAALLVSGLVVGTAPVVVLPVIRWVTHIA